MEGLDSPGPNSMKICLSGCCFVDSLFLSPTLVWGPPPSPAMSPFSSTGHSGRGGCLSPIRLGIY